MTQLNLSDAPMAQRHRAFVILTPARSGSNMLASAMNSHPEIVCFGDFFAAENFPWLGGDVQENTIDGEMIHHIRNMRTGLVNPDKIIVLTREAGAIAQSRKDMFNRKHVHLIPGWDGVPPSFQGRIDTEDAGWPFSTPEAVEHEAADIRAYAEHRDSLFVRYEALISLGGALDRHETDRICDYLGVNRAPLTPLTQKLPKVRV